MWKIYTGDLKSDRKVIIPDQMREHWRDDDREVWRRHESAGDDFTVTVRRRVNEDGMCAASISYSGYAGSDFVEAISFPVLTYPCSDEDRFLHGGRDLGCILTRQQWIAHTHRDGLPSEATTIFAILRKNAESDYMDVRTPFHIHRTIFGEFSEDGSSVTIERLHTMGCAEKPAAEGGLEGECVWGKFRGGWFEAGQIYKKWALKQPWALSRTKENPLRDIGLWVWNRGRSTHVLPPVFQLQKDLPGIRIALDWYWWHSNPYDTDYPDFLPPREGDKVFREAVAELNRRGIFSQVYVNGVCWDMDSPGWSQGGSDGVVIERNGKERAVAFNKYNQHRLAWQCGEAPAFQDRLARVVNYLYKTGLSGQYLDMISAYSLLPCYNPAHHHPMGGGTFMADGYRNFLARLKRENPGFPLSSESCSEIQMEHFDSMIVCNTISSEQFGNSWETVPLFPSIYHGKNMPALYGNYAFADGTPPWDELWPDKDRWQGEEDWHTLYPEQFYILLMRGVIWGIQPMVCNITPRIYEDEAYAEIYRTILACARFYHEHLDYLFDGQMCSPEGFSCKEQEMQFMGRMIFTKRGEEKIIRKTLPCVLHSVWERQDGTRMLFLANVTQNAQEWLFNSPGSGEQLNGIIGAHELKAYHLLA